MENHARSPRWKPRKHRSERSKCRSSKSLDIEALETRHPLAVGDLLGSFADPSTTPQFGLETGSAISADAELVAIGAPSADLHGFNNVGQVHIYNSQTESLVSTIPNPFPAGGDRFGDALAISGTTLVVGSRSDDTTGTDSGQVTVFNALTGALIHVIDNPSPAEFDYFGDAVAIEHNTIVVGARLDDADGMDTGSAYVFDAQTGTLNQRLLRPNAAGFDYFGSSVAISGDRIAVGVPRHDDAFNDSGAVELYNRITGTFDRVIANPTANDFDFFGNQIGLSGSKLVVGAHSDNGGAVNTGAAYIFDAADGALLHTLPNPEPALADNFGAAVSVAGDTVVIGAYRDNTGANDAGKIYQYSATTGLLERAIANPTPDAFDYFGVAVATTGNSVLAGAHQDDTAIEDSGAVYFFDATTGDGTASFFSPTPAAHDYFGQSVAVAGRLVAVGAHLDDTHATDSGVVHVFDQNAGTLLHTIPNPAPAAYDNFGASVAMWTNLLVVGAHRDDAGATDAGSVYLFDAETGALIETIHNPAPAAFDAFGSAVAIGDGTILVGASQDDTTGNGSGTVYGFDAPTGALTWTLPNPAPDDFDGFGESVDIKGDLVAIGASGDDTNGNNTGIAYVFHGPQQSLIATLVDPEATADDFFGSAVSISGSTVIVGAPRKDWMAPDSGAALQFDATTGTLIRVIGSNQSSENGLFGAALSSSDDYIAIGAYGELVNSRIAGTAYLHDAVSGDFVAQLASPIPDHYDTFGISLALGTDLVAVGAPLADGLTTDRGEVHLFDTSNPNTPPIADAGGPYSGVEGEPVTLDATGSSDNEDVFASLQFEWDLDYDGMVFDSDTVGAQPTVTFDDNFASRSIAIRVTDSDSLSTLATTTLQIGNANPTITTNATEVTVVEGATGMATGSFTDVVGDTVSLSASIGEVLDNGDGTWGWTYATTDGPDDSQSVTITADDDDQGSSEVMFALTVANAPPSVDVDNSSIAVSVGDVATNAGTFGDAGLDTVTLSSSAGNVVSNGDGTWSWSLQTTQTGDSQAVTITATDSDGATAIAEFALDVSLVTTDLALVVVEEGETAYNGGHYVDPGANTVVLSASIGDVVDNDDGTWNWSFGTMDGPADGQLVVISAIYTGGVTDDTAFQLSVLNIAPSLIVDQAELSVVAGRHALNSGTFDDPGSDSITLTASKGTVIDNGDGSWSWSWQSGKTAFHHIVITATDSDGAMRQTTFTVMVLPSTPRGFDGLRLPPDVMMVEPWTPSTRLEPDEER